MKFEKIHSEFMVSTYLDVFEIKHVSLDKRVLYFLVSPCHK